MEPRYLFCCRILVVCGLTQLPHTIRFSNQISFSLHLDDRSSWHVILMYARVIRYIKGTFTRETRARVLFEFLFTVRSRDGDCWKPTFGGRWYSFRWREGVETHCGVCMMFFVALFENVTIWKGFLDRETKYTKSVNHIAIPFHTLCSIIVPRR